MNGTTLFDTSIVVDTPWMTSEEWGAIGKSSERVFAFARGLELARWSLGDIPDYIEPIEFDLDNFRKVLGQSDALFIGGGDKSLLAGLTSTDIEKLRYLSVHATGYEHIPEKLISDSHSCDGTHIIATRIPEYATSAVAEYVVANVMGLLRRPEYSSLEYCCSQPHHFGSPQGESLIGKQVAIVGMGLIGSQVARIMSTLGASVKPINRTQQNSADWIALSDQNGVERTLKESQIVSLHLPDIGDEILDESRLRGLAPGTIVVNTARPALLNESVLLELVNSGKLRAVLDVLAKPELLPTWHQNVLCGRAIITHHIAFNTKESRDKKAELFVGNLQAYERSLRQGNFSSCCNTIWLDRCQECLGNS